jgi:nicotinate-nucleotide adenylyltransferase
VRIGVFGGTFDPVHYGHLRPAEEVARALDLDTVFFVPNNQSPIKPDQSAADPRHRVAMLALALSGNRKFVLSLEELDRPAPSFTVATLSLYRSRFPAAEIFLLLGTDALASFSRWRDPEGIFRLARLAAFVREPVGEQRLWADPLIASRRESILIFDSVRVTISSTQIRQAIRNGKPISGWTPPGVEEYIFKQNLYKESTDLRVD